MNRSIFACVLLCVSMLTAQDQPVKNRWAAWQPFLGTWVGSGSGQPGQGAGEFTLETSLQGAVLLRHNFAEYAATKDKAAYRHDDLMVIYADSDKTRADYWDNEDHVIHYGAEVSGNKLVFLSDETQAGPRFRLTYVKTGADTLQLMFEIAPPNDRGAFKTYVTAEVKRKK
jgi:hypothetical protein